MHNIEHQSGQPHTWPSAAVQLVTLGVRTASMKAVGEQRPDKALRSSQSQALAALRQPRCRPLARTPVHSPPCVLGPVYLSQRECKGPRLLAQPRSACLPRQAGACRSSSGRFPGRRGTGRSEARCWRWWHPQRRGIGCRAGGWEQEGI